MNIDNPEFKLDTKTEQEMRWQSSPLVHHIDQVIKAYEAWAKNARVGNNAATVRIVGAAEELALLREEIYRGERDGLGYPIEEEK